jgi:hypothetical protein
MARFVPPSYPERVNDGNEREGEPMASEKELAEARGDCYEIRLQGCLDDHWTSWFGGGLKLTAEPPGETVLSGRVPDQCALLSVLRKIHDLGLTLISVQRRKPKDEA